MDSQVNPGRIIPANCDELFERGQSQSGNYLIQPSMDVVPFEVNCNFDNGLIKTIIAHDKPEEERTATIGINDGCDAKS